MVLLILVALAGVLIYTVTTNQRIDLTEDVSADGLELTNPAIVDGLTVNLVEEEGDGRPVLLLHDVDVTGGLLLADVALALPEGWQGIRMDMPGFGYSDRLPTEGPHHTAARMAEVVAAVIEEGLGGDVVVAGVGFGGEVAAEVALTRPDLVTGMVMVDTDFSAGGDWKGTLETLPFVGRAATYTWETGGRFALEEWQPFCELGGWCASPDQLAERALIVVIEGTTQSLHSFLRTPAAALASSNLEDITVPSAYVWSTQGDVPRESVDRVVEGLPGVTLHESGTFQAHLEDVSTMVAAITGLGG